MFTITFYSYKGGVGRTMSLVNVAAELSQRGRRVLIIDFDLEAPGIPSFKQFSASESQPGVVDYVSQYIETSIAPEVKEFIVETNLDTAAGNIPVWVLPAGKRDHEYGAKLSSIDWQDLYQNRSGYLLFEDLKQQIATDLRAFDYILIDSRTGHTDVGGICTRQLADAIVFMFFPNKQNISGLKTIVEEIRNDRHIDYKRTKMLFCPSNVPDLDDEDGILKSMLNEASSELGYESPASTIRHYNSMSLVDQKIFVVERPRTKLAAQYRCLTEALMRLNIGDREGAILYLQQIASEVGAGWKRNADRKSNPSVPLNEITDQLRKINAMHSGDGEVSWLMAGIYHDLGDFENEKESLNGALKADYNVAKVYLRRAFIHLSQSQRDEAKADLIKVLNSPNATPTDLRSAIEGLKSFEKKWLELVKATPLLEQLDANDVIIVSSALWSDSAAMHLAAHLLEKAYLEPDHRDDLSRDILRSHLILALISSGQFNRAMNIIQPRREQVIDDESISDLFNYAVAEWGETGVPPSDLFTRALKLYEEPTTDRTNYYQCFALVNAALGNMNEAMAFVTKARNASTQGAIFSCWTYLSGRRSKMIADLDEMETSFRDHKVVPPVVTRKRTVYNFH